MICAWRIRRLLRKRRLTSQATTAGTLMRSRGWLQQLEARILHTAVCQQLSGQKILSIMKLHRLRHGIVAEESGTFHEIPAASWDELVAREDLAGHVRQLIQGARPSHRPEMHDLM